MRWVDRGTLPPDLSRYELNNTQDWVDYYERRTGNQPLPHWGKFREELAGRFESKCGYCERRCDLTADGDTRAPTIDHFKPRHLYPKLTYAWTNWVFSCYQCNVENKKDKWPPGGYVDPCAADVWERPDNFFDYDEKTGEIVPKLGLSEIEHDKACRTINDLGLNSINVLCDRFDAIETVRNTLMYPPSQERSHLIKQSRDPSVEFSGIVGMFLSKNPASDSALDERRVQMV